ncbi:ATP-binding protein [Aquabacterium sp.]|uniref:sensor histidine kinase n=1 Tax=Aquabacterium sp. TaxID=1872578 RepID=UPI00248884C6|nr:ATP-binding protein [Aquabacterium sp.]MDI1260695.1 ATP-binding protein [Aquabacterium sp.]
MSAMDTSPPRAAPDLLIGGSGYIPTLDEVLQGSHDLPRWIGWRLRMLVGAVLMGFVLVLLVGQWLSSQPRLPVSLRATSEGTVRLHSVDNPAMQRLEGHILEGLRSEVLQPGGGTQVLETPIEMLALQRSGRWISDAEQRQHFVNLHLGVARLLDALPADGKVLQLQLVNAPDEPVLITPRGWSGLSPLFWLLSALALTLFAVGAVVVLAGPQLRNLAYLALALSQAGQLMFIAVETNLDLFLPEWFMNLDMRARGGLDLVTAAAMIQVAVLHPRRLKGWPYFIALGWAAAAGLGITAMSLDHPNSWLWLHVGCTLMTAAAVLLMGAAYRASPHPFTLVLQRFSIITLATWVLLSVAVAHGGARPDMLLNITTFGVMTWHVFFASQLLLAPYLSRSKQILQEFSLLAASSTVAASLDLLFVAVFSLGQFTSMTLSLFLSFGVYMSIRRWLMTRLPGRDPITMERLFERLYRMARELERRPAKTDDLLARLMRELFDPLEVTVARGEVFASELRGNGSVMLVRLPSLRLNRETPSKHALVLKHSNKGRRLFTSEDARLADRIIDQLHRVLSFDQAVEQGRSEERVRIAQDLHDDIGARLLTLMYQAPNANIEEYIRHTLQDLKTLTRGLAAQSHGLSEAAGEWKRDLHQRLGFAQCELTWQMTQDCDVSLSMGQWSALTRILRELVNNTISHAKASKVQVQLVLANDRLSLTVTDNGVGRAPETWSHGLGLGGVRKRVKQLGGTVRWSEAEPKGVCCEVVVENFSATAGPAADSEL